MDSGIIEIDVHGKTRNQAIVSINAVLGSCNTATYRIRVIHGYHGGTSIKEMILDEYGYGRSERVKRIQPGVNPGITELVLREY